jgi:DNA-binding transcriptional ArsR family regulator
MSLGTDNSIISQYAGEIPKDVKNVIKALNDDNRVAIIVALMKNSRMTFTELKKLFDIAPSSMTYHLSILQDGGLVHHYLEKPSEGSYSYYATTELVETVLGALYDNIMMTPITKFETPPQPKIEELQKFEQKEFDIASTIRLRRYGRAKHNFLSRHSRFSSLDSMLANTKGA